MKRGLVIGTMTVLSFKYPGDNIMTITDIEEIEKELGLIVVR